MDRGVPTEPVGDRCARRLLANASAAPALHTNLSAGKTCSAQIGGNLLPGGMQRTAAATIGRRQRANAGKNCKIGCQVFESRGFYKQRPGPESARSGCGGLLARGGSAALSGAPFLNGHIRGAAWIPVDCAAR